MAQNLIYSINGPVVTIKGKTGLSMMEMVLDPEALAASVKEIREQFSQHKL